MLVQYIVHYFDLCRQGKRKIKQSYFILVVEMEKLVDYLD